MTPRWQKQKYSLTEKEKRYLLNALPKDLPLNTCRIINDLYFPDTRLRLRKITDVAGETLELKLTQKFIGSDKVDERVITNLYLSEQEYSLFVGLPGHVLTKRRYSYTVENDHYAVDVFQGHLIGLVMAEIEFGDRPNIALPAFAIREVTDEPFFTGGHLARLSQDAFQKGLAAHL